MRPRARGRRAARAVLLTVLLATSLTACSMSNPFEAASLGPPLPVLAQEAVAAYDGAASVEVRGSYQVGSIPVTVEVSMQPAATGALRGQGTYRGYPLTVVGKGGKTFTEGVQYWQMEGAGGLRIWPAYGQGWVQAPPGDPGAGAIGASRDLGGLVAQLARQTAALRSTGTSELGGRQIASLRDGLTTYDVTTTAPYRLVAVRRKGTSTSPGGLSHVNLQVGYGGSLGVSIPGSGQYVDPRDAATFPALYETQSMTDLQSCDQTSCGFSATLINTTGPEQGSVTATLGLYQDPQFTQLIGSCDVPVPSVANGQT
ncbi:MAG: hypothetical protein ACRDL8_02865, partial [Solirubrobacteraceae bacterium]